MFFGTLNILRQILRSVKFYFPKLLGHPVSDQRPNIRLVGTVERSVRPTCSAELLLFGSAQMAELFSAEHRTFFILHSRLGNEPILKYLLLPEFLQENKVC